MKTCSKLVAATFTVVFSGFAAAAGASASISETAVMKTPEQHAKKDAMVVKNDRMTKCKAMTGDDKSNCEKQAKADAKKVMSQHSKDEGASNRAKP